MTSSVQPDSFERHRPELLALAYRMLGDMGRAEDVVQDVWMRYSGAQPQVHYPRAFLLKVTTRLCLNELGSARARREESRGDALPEPVDLSLSGFEQQQSYETISMAFMVMLRRLTPAERAVFLLHDIFGFEHVEIAQMLDRSVVATRQMLKRAKEHLASGRRELPTQPDEHERLLHAFVAASRAGDVQALLGLLVPDAVLVADTGPETRRFGRARNVGKPLVGAKKIAAFAAAVTGQGVQGGQVVSCRLNGEPALALLREEKVDSAITIACVGGRISHVFIHADLERLSRVVRLPD